MYRKLFLGIICLTYVSCTPLFPSDKEDVKLTSSFFKNLQLLGKTFPKLPNATDFLPRLSTFEAGGILCPDEPNERRVWHEPDTKYNAVSNF